MMKILVRILAVLLVLPVVAHADGVRQDKKYRLLYLTQSKGFTHGSVRRKGGLAPSEVAVTQWGKETGLYEAECIQDASLITAEKLKDVDIVMFYTTGMLPIPKYDDLDAWIKKGGAFVGVHSSTDTYKKHAPYYEMINGSFAGHPWGSGSEITVAVHEPSHPTVKMLGKEFEFRDEIYQYRNYNPASVRVLYSLDMAKTKKRMPYHVPICWVRTVGKGRLFYTNLGHREDTWTKPLMKDHMMAGFKWALGLIDGPSEPNPEVQAIQDAKAFCAVKAIDEGKDGVAVSAAVGAYAEKNADWVKKYTALCATLRMSDRRKVKERNAALEALYKEVAK